MKKKYGSLVKPMLGKTIGSAPEKWQLPLLFEFQFTMPKWGLDAKLHLSQ